MAESMKLVTDIITISRGGSYRDVVDKFMTNNKHLAQFINVNEVISRIDEIYQKHCDSIPNIAYYVDYLMHTSLSWISDNKHGYNGYFKYIGFTYRLPSGAQTVQLYWCNTTPPCDGYKTITSNTIIYKYPLLPC